VWHHATGVLALDQPRILGIINVTPDSFSDGGAFFSPTDALTRGGLLIAEGADVLDVGGESTRPHATVQVPAAEELKRVVPVIEALRARFPSVPISIDTVKSEVAAAALRAGASIINDVSAFRLDPAMAGVAARSRAGVILMHSRGDVRDMATFVHARYGEDVVEDVIAELRDRIADAQRAGVEHERIVIDPGVGFSKRSTHSLAVLAGISRLLTLGFPVVIGASRKRFIGEITGVAVPGERLAGTIAAHVAALDRGARLFRVHDVKAHRQALDVAWAIAVAGSGKREAGVGSRKPRAGNSE